MEYNKKLILEDGQEYYGYGFGANENKVCELVFNTSMAGYQEILSDPSYTYQAIVMSYPLIGNYGMAEDDYESENLTAGALIVHEYNDHPSNFRSAATLSDIMEKYKIPGIYGLDTRKLVRLHVSFKLIAIFENMHITRYNKGKPCAGARFFSGFFYCFKLYYRQELFKQSLIFLF